MCGGARDNARAYAPLTQTFQASIGAWLDDNMWAVIDELVGAILTAELGYGESDAHIISSIEGDAVRQAEDNLQVVFVTPADGDPADAFKLELRTTVDVNTETPAFVGAISASKTYFVSFASVRAGRAIWEESDEGVEVSVDLSTSR